jgi:hypothetical protein
MIELDLLKFRVANLGAYSLLTPSLTKTVLIFVTCGLPLKMPL